MRRKSWGGEVERTGNGAVDRNEEMGSGCGCLTVCLGLREESHRVSGISQIILGSDQIYRHFLLKCQQKQVAIQVDLEDQRYNNGCRGYGQRKSQGRGEFSLFVAWSSVAIVFSRLTMVAGFGVCLGSSTTNSRSLCCQHLCVWGRGH